MFLRVGLPTAADHEIASFSTISAPFGLKRAESNALEQPQAEGEGGDGPWVLTYSAAPLGPLVCVGQPHLLLVQQRGEEATACHGGEGRTYFQSAVES